jgi:hypothetical protein
MGVIDRGDRNRYPEINGTPALDEAFSLPLIDG